MNLDHLGYLEDFPSFFDEGSPLCGQTDPEIFFPIDNSDWSLRNIEHYSNEREAKAVCAECPFKSQCAAYALERPEIQGIWGGLTQTDRRRLKKRLRIRKTA